jgi:ribosomal protein S27E
MSAEPPPKKKVQAMRVSGYVLGPCSTCAKEQRGLVMFDDYAWGVECLACGATERVDEVEYVPEGEITY